MKRLLVLVLLVLSAPGRASGLATVTLAGQAPQRNATSRRAPAPQAVWRPPAVPLVAHDPYFSIWSPADRLTDAATVHWTGRAHPMTSLIRIDGDAARLMGAAPTNVAALPQTSVTVRPTHTIYKFANARVKVELTFMTPSLPSDLDVLSRPVTYITWNVASADAKPHQVQIYFDCGADIAVNTADQSVQLDYPKVDGLAIARVGTSEQPVLARRGDDVRIDWGYGYLAAPGGGGTIVAGGSRKQMNSLLRGSRTFKHGDAIGRVTITRLRRLGCCRFPISRGAHTRRTHQGSLEKNPDLCEHALARVI